MYAVLSEWMLNRVENTISLWINLSHFIQRRDMTKLQNLSL